MCEKIPYDKDEARRIAQGMSRVHNQTMEPYKCDQCEYWHLRTAGKKKKAWYKQKYPLKFEYQPKEEKRKKHARRK